MRTLRSILVVLSAMFVLSGCAVPLGRLPQKTGSLILQAALPASVAESDPELELILKQNTRVRRFPVPYADGIASIEVDQLYEGMWDVTLQLVDAEGDVIYIAQAAVPVFADRANTAELRLVPAPGVLEVFIDLTSLQEESSVRSARVTVASGGYSSATRQGNETLLRIERTMEPQTYDIRVSLYGEQANESHVVYHSPWTPVTIRPGKRTTVHWSVRSGDLSVIGTILPALEAPAGFAAAYPGDGTVLFTWEPVAHADGYRLYERRAPFDQFRIVANIPGDATSWVLDASGLAAPDERLYALAAFNDDGFESARTEPVTVTFPVPGVRT